MGSGQPDLCVNHSRVILKARVCPQSSNMGALPSPGDCCEDKMRHISLCHLVGTQEVVDSLFRPTQPLTTHLQEREKPPCTQHTFKNKVESHTHTQNNTTASHQTAKSGGSNEANKRASSTPFFWLKNTQMQNSEAKKSFQQNSMSKLEMVPWNTLSLVIKIMLYSRAGTEVYLANVGRVKDKEGTH